MRHVMATIAPRCLLTGTVVITYTLNYSTWYPLNLRQLLILCPYYAFHWVIIVGVARTKIFHDHLFVPLLFQADYQRRFQEIVFGDIRNVDVSKISSLVKQGVDPNIYNKVGRENNITTLLVSSLVYYLKIGGQTSTMAS